MWRATTSSTIPLFGRAAGENNYSPTGTDLGQTTVLVGSATKRMAISFIKGYGTTQTASMMRNFFWLQPGIATWVCSRSQGTPWELPVVILT